MKITFAPEGAVLGGGALFTWYFAWSIGSALKQCGAPNGLFAGVFFGLLLLIAMPYVVPIMVVGALASGFALKRRLLLAALAVAVVVAAGIVLVQWHPGATPTDKSACG